MIAPVRISPLWRVSTVMLPEELYAEYYPLLLRIAERRYRIPAGDSHDIVQEILRVFLSKTDLENAHAYLVASVRNRCRRYWEREARFDRNAILAEQLRAPRVERIMAIRRVLRKLPRLERVVLVLRARGWRIAEIAEHIGYSVSWTEKLLRRARETAKEELDLTNRWRVWRGVGRTDTYVSVDVRALHRPVLAISSCSASGAPLSDPSIP
jgi:RNA polymerase sigma factor (sigma-70 family)